MAVRSPRNMSASYRCMLPHTASGPRSPHLRAALLQQLAEQAPVATGLILTVAADREVGGVGEGGQEVQGSAVLGSGHLGPVPPREGGPLTVGRGAPRGLHRFRARRQVGIPDVVEVPLRVLALRHAPRRMPNRSDPQPLAGEPGAPQSYDPYRHRLTSSPARVPQVEPGIAAELGK